MIEGGSHPPIVVSCLRGHVGCWGLIGVECMGRGEGESITTNAISSRQANATATNQRPAFTVHRTVEVRIYPHV